MSAAVVALPHRVFKRSVQFFPLFVMIGGKHIINEALELGNLRNDLVLLLIDAISVASDSLQIWAKQRVELFEGDAYLLHILQDALHVLGLHENLLGFRKVPALNCSLQLNLHFSRVELALPFVKHRDALIDDVDGGIWFLSENALDINDTAHFVTDFVRYALQQILHLALILVDVTGDSPNKLQPLQE